MTGGNLGGILGGVRVLDLSRMLSGPYCTMMLADHGAEVIKIESPSGDTSRGNGPYRKDDPDREWAGYFVSLNRNKKSVLLDLKSPEGREALRGLAASADVLVENYRPGVMERLGLGYESLAEINPALVYAAVRGFGDPRSGQSPYDSWPSYDVVAQAMGGVMSMTGPDADHPTKVGPGIGDIFSGMVLAFGVIAALRQAEATGKGQFVDVAMYDAMISLCERAIYLHDFTGAVPGPQGNGHPFLAPFGLFPARDGAVALGIVDDAFWRALAQATGIAGLAEDERFATQSARSANAPALNALLADWTGGLTKAELTGRLGGLVPFGPLNDVSDIVADPHVAARGMLAEIPHPDPGKAPWTVAANPLRFSGAPAPAPGSPPRIGADSDTYLSELPPMPMLEADKRSLRDAFGAFATGVTVVTTVQPDGTPRGFTANSFTSVSLDPPMVLVCLSKSAHSCPVFMQAPHFAVNVLAEDQRAVSGVFASRDADKFDQVGWETGAAGMPVLQGTLASIVCARDKGVDAGDHVILLGRVIDHQVGAGARPLGFFKGSYFSVGVEDDLVNAATRSGVMEIGALLVRGEQLLMRLDPDGRLGLPKAPGKQPSLSSLSLALENLGLKPRLDFLYAVYQDSTSGHHGIFYHGTVSGLTPPEHRFINLVDIPLAKIEKPAERSMLARFIQEFQHGSFGIYQGDETRGLVQRVTHPAPSQT